MRNVSCAVVALAALGIAAAPSSAAPSQPVRIVDRAVTLSAHDRVGVEVACLRARACRGEVVLGQQQLCSYDPVPDPRCQVVVGRGRFSLAPGERRRVTVRRVAGPGALSNDPDAVDVTATPYLRAGGLRRVGRRSRSLRLIAPAVVVRPGVAPTVTAVRRLFSGALLVSARVPLTTTASRVDLAGTTAELHQYTSTGYVTAPTSFAVGGARWHGQTPAIDDAPESGDWIPTRLVACAGERCTETDERRLVGSDPSMGPICRLPRATRLP
jgi:hypothetical protein